MPSRSHRRRTNRIGRPPADFSARSQILRGAMAAFGRGGYSETTVQDILVAAGVSRRTFYRFFANKDEVFSELFDRSVALIADEVEAAVNAAPDRPLARLEAGIEAYLLANAREGALARVLILEHMRPGSKFADRREAAIERFRQLIESHARRFNAAPLDGLLLSGLLAALDRITMELAAAAAGGDWDLERGKGVMLRILVGALTADVPAPTAGGGEAEAS